jgi:hypothetical protein
MNLLVAVFKVLSFIGLTVLVFLALSSAAEAAILLG